MLGLERAAISYRWPCRRRDLPLLFRTRLAYAATRVARHPPHLRWPAWTARGLGCGTCRQAPVIAGAPDVRFKSGTDICTQLDRIAATWLPRRLNSSERRPNWIDIPPGPQLS